MREIPFVTVDVFTSERFSGNPLAVITDARGLSDADMQKIATEFGYSETTSSCRRKTRPTARKSVSSRR